MKRKIGSFLMLLGALLVLAGAALFGYNRYHEKKAEESVLVLMPKLMSAIAQEQQSQEQEEPAIPSLPGMDENDTEAVPPAIMVDGNGYIGYVSIPDLKINLPILAQWSYPNLQIAPCYYAGSVQGNDLVLMAHNYRHHFGRIADLFPGDSVFFTDIEGKTVEYQVVALDVLAPDAIEEMNAGEYDLTLFTCTYGGQSRVTLRCDRKAG